MLKMSLHHECCERDLPLGGEVAISVTSPERSSGTQTLEQARAKAKKLLASATIGNDPAEERNAKRREMKVSALIDLYEAEGCYIQRGKRQGQPMKAKTKQFTVARLRHHVVPLLGHKRVTEVPPRDIERFFRDVEAGKTAKDEKVGPRKRIIVRGGNGAARKVFRDLSAAAAIALLKSIDEQEGSDFVFPAESGDGHYQGRKRIWGLIIKRANLPGVSPHTMRHTMGSAAISSGEATALSGAILGHSNPRSTAIYAHVQLDPSKKAANRVGKQIAGALKGEHRKPGGRKAA